MDGRTEPSRCPACGSVLLRYDTHSRAIVCMMCGRPVNHMEILQRTQQYHQRIQSAKEYIQVNNYSSALNILKDLRGNYPAQAEVYQLILTCLTEKGKDYLENSGDSRLIECVQCWEALKNLPDGINGRLQEYGRKRIELSRDRLRKIKIRVTLICLVIVFLAVCGWIKGGINLFYVLTGTALVILYKTGWIQKCRNIEKKLVEETDNPFQMIL